MPYTDQKSAGPAMRALAIVAKRFGIHLRLAREMYRDGYLKIHPELPDEMIDNKIYTHERRVIWYLSSYYEVCSDKIMRIYNKGHINLDGIDLQNEILRYMQRHSGELSVRLLCHLAYDELRPSGSVVKDRNANACLSALKIDGKLSPPKELEPWLGNAFRGHAEAVERVAHWMRSMIESVGKPHRWAFYGVRLALVEGSYILWNRPVPKLRRLRKQHKLAKLLREHPLLRGCVTPVARAGRNKDYFYIFHRPGEFWDL